MELPKLAPRSANSHKGTFGRVLVVGGSRGMAGAPALTGLAALRTGSGLVSIAIPESSLPITAGFSPCCMTIPLPEDAEGRLATTARTLLQRQLASANAIAIGPGLGQSQATTELVTNLFETQPECMVVDADGLNVLSSVDSLPPAAGPRILTPHIGEYRRLVRNSELSESECRCTAQNYALKTGVVLVLKGPQTLVTDGVRVYENSTGNPGMATAGSGDVLTGIVASLTGQGLEPFEAAILGVYLHGLAGDFAAERLGQASLIATDLIEHLPQAIKQHSRESWTAQES